MSSRVLGINAMGRIGKLTLWYHLDRDRFDSFVMNAGRQIGQSLDAVAQYLTKDSTYGPLYRWLDGHRGQPDVQIVDEEKGILRIHGKEVRILREARNPKDIDWAAHNVDIVVECSGKFRDVTVPADDPKGSIRGHLAAGAKVVVNSSAFKGKSFPDDAVMMIYGINHGDFDPAKHTIVSAASCTTTGLAHMLKPLIDHATTKNIVSASMATIHASTPSQMVLDKVPKADEKDLRKGRAVYNNIILTSTNAANALKPVMPQMADVGFMADSIRIPTTTGSLIALYLTIQTELDASGAPLVTAEAINKVYEGAEAGVAKDLLRVSYEQNVSSDIIGENAAAVIEAQLTDSTFATLAVQVDGKTVQVPVAQAKIMGWYDNELGSYTHRMGELTEFIADKI
jgi:glyceraldehyde 3-phosphate dehydrogenase